MGDDRRAMPHITLEHSANLPPPSDLPALFASCHEALARLGVALDDCRSRAYCCDSYRVGSGAPDRAFVHLTLAVLDRRPASFQREAGEHMLRLVREAFATGDVDCDVTVEVRAMRTETYFKARVAHGVIAS